MNKEKFLKEQKILRLATLDNKGHPHLVPVWYLYKTKKIYVGTNTRTKKAKNLMKNKNVGFCVDMGIKSPKIFGLMGNGQANLILEKNKVSNICKEILLRYFNNLDNRSAKELLEDTDCIIEINPKKFSQWSY